MSSLFGDFLKEMSGILDSRMPSFRNWPSPYGRGRQRGGGECICGDLTYFVGMGSPGMATKNFRPLGKTMYKL